MSKLENVAKETQKYFPRFLAPYVDDIFAVFDSKENLQHFFYTKLLLFTYEIENHNRLFFLDLTVIRKLYGNFNFDI